MQTMCRVMKVSAQLFDRIMCVELEQRCVPTDDHMCAKNMQCNQGCSYLPHAWYPLHGVLSVRVSCSYVSCIIYSGRRVVPMFFGVRVASSFFYYASCPRMYAYLSLSFGFFFCFLFSQHVGFAAVLFRSAGAVETSAVAIV